MKRSFAILSLFLLLVSLISFADTESGTVSTSASKSECVVVEARLEKALIDTEHMFRTLEAVRYDIISYYSIIAALFIVCAFLLAGFCKRGDRIEELENEISYERAMLGSRIPRVPIVGKEGIVES